MKTQTIRTSYRMLFLPVLAATALASGPVAALPNDASGHLDINSNGLPRLSPDTCYARNSVTATGSSNIPVVFRLFREGETNPVAQQETTWFNIDTGNIDFREGRYLLNAVNRTLTRPARITMTLNCG